MYSRFPRLPQSPAELRAIRSQLSASCIADQCELWDASALPLLRAFVTRTQLLRALADLLPRCEFLECKNAVVTGQKPAWATHVLWEHPCCPGVSTHVCFRHAQQYRADRAARAVGYEWKLTAKPHAPYVHMLTRALRVTAFPTSAEERAAQTQELPQDFIRASGEVKCPECGELYLQHPEDFTDLGGSTGFEPSLHVLCDGTRVKL